MIELLSKELKEIKGIGPRTANLLAKAELMTVRDLIEHFPYRYEDYRNSKTVSQLKPNEQITLQAQVVSIQNRKSIKNKRLSITEALLSDPTGSITAVWFNQPYLSSTLEKGKKYYFSGPTLFRGKLQLQSPQFEEIEGDQLNVGRLVPIYSLPEGIAPKRYRSLIFHILQSIPTDYDILSTEIKKKNNFLNLVEAWHEIHFPKTFNTLENARKRLGFDELLTLQLQILRRREFLKKSTAPIITFNQEKVKEFVDSLPFKLTLSQRKSAWEIIQDLDKSNPMNRILQGDVGSGKTAVAAIASYNTILSGFQVALMAPTEILAQQHFTTLKAIGYPASIKVEILTSGTKNKDEVYKKISSGKVDLVVGTHALIQEKVKFKNLGLLIVDEQHRFGVKQRSILRQAQDGQQVPHLLSMTATPIPRTLALTLYGDLSISTLTEMPPGRLKVITQIITPENRQKAYVHVLKELLSGRQAFVICPLVEESEALEVKSATEERERLAKDVFPNFSIGLIHGRMPPSEKDKIMRQFKDGEFHILVSTSVVEVGIDIPNATVIMIEGAERFGLSQLHQFRGRVGRGEHVSYCFLMPTTSQINSRLQAVAKYTDGFKLAELDLKFRGMGELYGVRQSGLIDLKIADPSDLELVKLARSEAEYIISQDVNLKNFPGLLSELNRKQAVIHPE